MFIFFVVNGTELFIWGSRQIWLNEFMNIRKIDLIKNMNPEWKDLYEEI